MGVTMRSTRFRILAVAAVAVITAGSTAQAFCSNNWADVTKTCPKSKPFTGPKHLTETSRNLPTVGTPGLYKNWGNGYDVRVYLGGNGTGGQKFHWQENGTSYPKNY